MEKLRQSVILAGGYGTRLGAETTNLPKPLVEIGNGPILSNLIRKLERDGIRRFVVAGGHKFEGLLSHFERLCNEVPLSRLGDSIYSGVIRGKSGDKLEISIVDSGETGTNGRLLSAESLLSDGAFLICYGDVLSDVSISELTAAWSGGDFDVLLTAGNPRSIYGEVSIGETGHVVSFLEKPVLYDTWVNIGFMVSNHTIFGLLKDRSENLEGSSLAHILRIGRLGAHQHRGFWMPIDNLSDLSRVRAMVREGDTPWEK